MVVFICVALTCIIILLIRRYVVGGELGGSQFGRTISCVALCSLWGIYILMSTLQAYGLLGEKAGSFGTMPEMDFEPSIKYWKTMCDKEHVYDTAGVNKYASNGDWSLPGATYKWVPN